MKRDRITRPLLAGFLLATLIAATALSSRVLITKAQSNGANSKPALEFKVKRGADETTVDMYYGSGVYKITAADAAGTRDVDPLRPGSQRTAFCDAKQQVCKKVKIEGGGTIKICVCRAKDGTTAMLLPAVQKVREAAGSSGGGSGCTTQSPCCYEDHKLQMSICYP